MAERAIFGLGRPGSFGRSVATLAGATAVGQAIAVLASPVLARLFSPEDFGVLAVYSAFVGGIGSLAALMYHRAIPLPESEPEAVSVLGVTCVASLLVTVATTLVFLFVGDWIVTTLNVGVLGPWLWMVPLGVLGLSLYEALTQWAIRKRAHGDIGRTSITRGIGQSGVQIGSGLTSAGPLGLLAGQLAGQWIGVGRLGLVAWRGASKAIREVRFANLAAAARRYRRFPIYSAPDQLFYVVGADAPAVLLSYFFGGGAAGLFAVATRVIRLPATLVSKSIAQVFLGSAPEARRRGTLGRDVGRLVNGLTRIAVPFAIPFSIAAPALFALVFGAQWREAGLYSRYLTPWVCFSIIGFPLTPLIAVLERQRAGAVFQMALLAVRVGSLVVGGILGDARLAVGLFGGLSGLYWVGYIGWLMTAAGAEVRVAIRRSFVPILEGLTGCVPIIFAVRLGLSDLAVSGLLVLVTGLLGLRMLLWLRREKDPLRSEGQ